jgi:hypothetical protein
MVDCVWCGFCGAFLYAGGGLIIYFPMQNEEKMVERMSSVSSFPGISPSASRASRRSMAASSGLVEFSVRSLRAAVR